MKRAKALDVRRALQHRKVGKAPTIQRVSVRNLSGFADAELDLNQSFVMVCGGTGIGKTALLESMYIGLTGDSTRSGAHTDRCAGADVQVSINSTSKETTPLDGTEDDEQFPQRTHLLGLPDRTADLVQYLLREGVEEVLDGVDPFDMSDPERALISRAVGKAYSNIEVFELDDEDFIRPYFKVREGNTSYGVLSMGTGELSILYISWFLRNAEMGSIVMIEEPEAFLPPTNHSPVFDIIAAAAKAKNLGVIITTHSAEMVSLMPRQHLVPLRRSGGQTVFASTDYRKEDILSRLGLVVPKAAVVFVEDDLAEVVLTALLGAFDPNLYAKIEIANLKTGFGDIKKAMDCMPALKSLEFVAALDGDMRQSASSWNRADKCCFLPFQTSMEEEFITAISARTVEFARLSFRSEERVEATLERVGGQEPHDAFHDLIHDLTMSTDQAGQRCFEHWTGNKGATDECRSFVKHLAELVKLKGAT